MPRHLNWFRNLAWIWMCAEFTPEGKGVTIRTFVCFSTLNNQFIYDFYAINCLILLNPTDLLLCWNKFELIHRQINKCHGIRIWDGNFFTAMLFVSFYFRVQTTFKYEYLFVYGLVWG